MIRFDTLMFFYFLCKALGNSLMVCIVGFICQHLSHRFQEPWTAWATLFVMTATVLLLNLDESERFITYE